MNLREIGINLEKLSNETLILLTNTFGVSPILHDEMMKRQLSCTDSKYVMVIKTLHDEYNSTNIEHFNECKYFRRHRDYNDLCKLIADNFLEIDLVKDFICGDFEFKKPQNTHDVLIYLYLYVSVGSKHYIENVNLNLLSDKEILMLVPLVKDEGDDPELDDMIEYEFDKRRLIFGVKRIREKIDLMESHFVEKMININDGMEPKLTLFKPEIKENMTNVLDKWKFHYRCKTIYHYNKCIKYVNKLQKLANEIEEILKIDQYSVRASGKFINSLISKYNLVEPDLPLNNKKHYSYTLKCGKLISTRVLVSMWARHTIDKVPIDQEIFNNNFDKMLKIIDIHKELYIKISTA